jgi:hypothetical protein
MTRSSLEQLDIDRNMGTSPENLAEKLKVIIAKHDENITPS